MVGSKQIFALLFITLLQHIGAADFGANSFVFVGANLTHSFLREYSYDGTFLQEIVLGNYVSGGIPKLDSTGTILGLQTYNQLGSKLVTYAHAMNSKGQITDSTAYIGNNIPSDSVLDGQNVWMSEFATIKYIPRGTNQSVDITAQSSNQYQFMQLVGTRLYVVVSGPTLRYMDPVVTTGTSTFTTLTGVGSISHFSFLSRSVLYAVIPSPAVLIRYNLDVDRVSASEAYRISLPVTINFEAVKNVYAMEVQGKSYIFTLIRSLGLPPTKIYRYTDDGSGFVDSTLVYNDLNTPEYIGAAPRSPCLDGKLDADETDIDCGGTYCNIACANDKTCSINTDCTSGYCTSGNKCADPTCNDDVQNGKETDVDCGGIDCNKCEIGKKCKLNSDCKGDLCDNGICIVSCTDGLLNNGESDIDCGGYNCTTCIDGKNCQVDGDCTSAYCNPNSTCSVPSCSDTFLNQDETDVDCGGNIFPKCDLQKICDVASDCSSGYCNPSKNCYETDIDCGGATCSACANDKSCVKNSDCESNTCTGNVCVNPPVAEPISEPVSEPVSEPSTDSPVSDSSPSTSTQPASPSATPIKRKSVSTGAIIETSVIGLLAGLSAFIFV